MINMDPATLSLDKTWKEIYDNSDKLCVIIYEDGSEDEFVKQFNYIYSLEHSPNGDYVVTCIYYTGQGYAQNILVTDNENDYPHVPEG